MFLPFSRYFRLRLGLLMVFFGLVALGSVQTTAFVQYQFSGPSAWILIIVGSAVALSSLIETRAHGRPEQQWESVADAGKLLGMNERWVEAMSEFRRAMTMTGPEPRRLRAAEDIGGYLVDHKKLTEAAPFLADALTLRTRLFGPAQPQTVALRERLGDLYMRTGQAAAAAQLMRSQVDLLAGTAGIDVIGQANAEAKLSAALRGQGDVSGAQQAAQRATAAIEAAPDQFSPALVKPLMSLSGLALSEGDYGRAESLLIRAQECASRVGAKDDLSLVRARLLSVYSAAGRYTEAAPLSEKMLSESAVMRPAPDPAETARLHREHADLLDRAGRAEDAIKHRRIAETLARIGDASKLR